VNVSYVPSFYHLGAAGLPLGAGVVLVTKDNVTVPQSSEYNTISEALAGSDEFLSSLVDMSWSGDEIENHRGEPHPEGR